MIYTSMMTSKGQVTIPQRIRKAMKLLPKQRVQFSERVEDGETVTVISPVPDIRELAGKFKPKRKVIDPVKIREYMETHYERA